MSSHDDDCCDRDWTETTALAGATTESLRNIELVKSLGLTDQEVKRLNSTTDKILKLELKKVRYLRSLSFVQGTAVNFMRTTILFLMLFLIFRQICQVVVQQPRHVEAKAGEDRQESSELERAA